MTRGSGRTWLLRVSAAKVPALGVPFFKNDTGQWEMSPVIEAVQHIDVVPAR